MMLSILHRHRTCALCRHRPFGPVAAGLLGPEAYAQVQAVSSAWYGRLVCSAMEALFLHVWRHSPFGIPGAVLT